MANLRLATSQAEISSPEDAPLPSIAISSSVPFDIDEARCATTAGIEVTNSLPPTSPSASTPHAGGLPASAATSDMFARTTQGTVATRTPARLTRRSSGPTPTRSRTHGRPRRVASRNRRQDPLLLAPSSVPWLIESASAYPTSAIASPGFWATRPAETWSWRHAISRRRARTRRQAQNGSIDDASPISNKHEKRSCRLSRISRSRASVFRAAAPPVRSAGPALWPTGGASRRSGRAAQAQRPAPLSNPAPMR